MDKFCFIDWAVVVVVVVVVVGGCYNISSVDGM
jgi:hypothetical protein